LWIEGDQAATFPIFLSVRGSVRYTLCASETPCTICTISHWAALLNRHTFNEAVEVFATSPQSAESTTDKYLREVIDVAQWSE